MLLNNRTSCCLDSQSNFSVTLGHPSSVHHLRVSGRLFCDAGNLKDLPVLYQQSSSVVFLCTAECLTDSFMKAKSQRTIMSCIGKVQQSFSYLFCRMSGRHFYKAGILKDCPALFWSISAIFSYGSGMSSIQSIQSRFKAKEVSCQND